MRKKFKIIFIVCAVFLVIFFLAGILVGIYAPKIIESQIQDNLKLKTTLGKVSLSLPFTVTLERLEIGRLANIKKISFSPNLPGLLFGKIIIHGLRITEPVIYLEQSADGKLNLPALEQKDKPPAVYLTSFSLQDGKIVFTDRKITPAGFEVTLDKLNIKVGKVSLPITSLAADFNLSARLVDSKGEPFGSFVFAGWLDYLAKDIDAKLEVKDLDVVNFSPYYGNLISNKKLLSASLNLDSTFKAENNQLEIITGFNLSKLVYEETKEQEPDLGLMKDALDLFCDAEGNLKLEFKINTSLDNPSLSQEQLRKIILKAAMKNLARQSPQQLMDKVAGAIDKYRELGKELKSIFGK